MRTSGIAPSVRVMLAMFRLYADIATGFGQAIIDILKKQYPGENIDLNPSSLGHKLMNIAKKQVQQDETRAQDVIQDFLGYLVGVRKPDKEGNVRPGMKWDFKKDFPDWHEALDNIFTNIRRRAISESMGKSKKKKKERGIDDAFGQRPEGGGDPEGGEGKMPTDPESALGKSLDDKAAVKEFIDLIDSHVSDLRTSLKPDTRMLFDLIFEEDVGSFGSDIKENMGQASALKEKLEALSADSESPLQKEAQKILKDNEKRWSGFVGDLRKRLLEEILAYLDKNMPPAEFASLREMFFSDADPSAVRRLERKKVEDKGNYQRDIDLRKFARFKWKEQNSGPLPPEEQKSYDALKKKLTKEGFDEAQQAKVAPEEPPAGWLQPKPKKDKKKPESPPGSEQVASMHRVVALRVATKKIVPRWS